MSSYSSFEYVIAEISGTILIGILIIKGGDQIFFIKSTKTIDF